MPHLKTSTATTPANLHYLDYGRGRPVVLIHGWPLSHAAWEPQLADLVEAGFRVVTYCRRGFGHSSAPWDGYDYDALAADLHDLMTELDLRNATLVGFSMGGGEVVRYCTKYGTDRLAQCVLMSSIIPLVPQKDDNPDGVPQEMLEEIMGKLKTDRVGYLTEFTHNFYNYADNKDRVSKEQLHYDWNIAAHASPRATIKTAEAWGGTDFRPECKNVTVPTLIIHGDADNVVPIATAGDQAAELIPDNRYHVIKGGPHGLGVTHREEVNSTLIRFLRQG